MFVGADDGEEGVGEHGQGDPAELGGEAAESVLVQSGQTLCGLEGLCLAAKVPRRAWQKLSAGAGAKGHRFCDWAVIDLSESRAGSHRLLIPPQPQNR